MGGSDKLFSSSDLLTFVESLVRSSKREMRSENSNYSWLTSRSIGFISTENDVDEFKPVVHKLTSENCVTIAVKLQIFAEEVRSTSEILTEFKNLLEQQYSIQLMGENVKRMKGTKYGKRKLNKVHPELTPPGRQATVSFILN